MLKAYLLNSSNFTSAVVTKRALDAIRLEMSTADYCTHRAVEIVVESFDNVWDVTLGGELVQYPVD